MVYPWNLSGNKSPQVSRTLLSILAYLDNAVVSIAYSFPFISKSSTSFTHPLKIVPTAPNTIGITINFMFRGYFCFLAKSRYVSFFFALFYYHFGVCRNGNVHYLAGFLFLLTITLSGRLAEIRWSICISKISEKFFCDSISRTDSG